MFQHGPTVFDRDWDSSQDQLTAWAKLARQPAPTLVARSYPQTPELLAIPPLNGVLGWSAAALTLLAFSCDDLVRLRYVALSANAAFIAHGLTAQLWPVLALHFVLVPINGWRLWQTLDRQPEQQVQVRGPAPASP